MRTARAISTLRSCSVVVAVLTASAGAQPASAPGAHSSPDCARAATSVEQAICADTALTALDNRLAEIYATASKAAGADQRNRLAADQQRWLEGRTACGKANDRAVCIRDRYLERIADLQAQFKLVPGRGPFRLACNGDPNNVLVAQYFETDPATARFTYDGRTATAFVQRSGSGARYDGRGVSYWEHQGEASVVWFGRTMKCSTR